MEPELQHLLMEKRFDQLYHDEKKWVLDNMTKEEYERCGSFLKLTKSSFEKDFRKMRPNPSIKIKVKNAYQQHFEDKITPSTFPTNKNVKESVLRPLGIYTSVTAVAVFAAVLYFQSKNNNLSNPNKSTTAMDIEQIENFELLNDQMSLKEAGMYSKMIVPETNIQTSMINPDTLLIP